jgi:peptidyl-prolyl cis-trans isomerase B (cyclophilin B)
LVDKPRRRKQRNVPWGKIAAVVIAGLVAIAAGWYIYGTYIYVPPPQYARVDTSLGSFYVELYPACAPKTVANFVTLAGLGFYDNLTWHRIVPNFVMQTGDPNTRGGLNSTRATWGQGGSNQTVPLEWCGWLHNYEGYVAMAHKSGDVNSGTSQFYVILQNQTATDLAQLDGSYTVFGKVISGMSVVQEIGNAKLCQPPTCPSSWPTDEPLPPVFVKDIVILSGPPSV